MSDDKIHRAMWLDIDRHAIDGEIRVNPTDLFAQGLAELMRMIARILCGSGVALLTARVAERVGLPTGKMPRDGAGKIHPAALELRRHGFELKEVNRWFHVKHDAIPGPGVWVGLEEFIDPDRCTIIGNTPERTTAAMAAWHTLTGHPWNGGAGDAGNTILRAQRYKWQGQMKPASWWSWTGPEGEPIEAPYLPNTWSRPTTAPAVYGYDRVRAYLSAMTCTQVAGKALTHTRLRAFNPQHCGWWLVRLGRWEFDPVLPDPAGYNTDDGSRTVWLTSPTVALLTELAAGGYYEFQVLDSWTAWGVDVMRKYGGKLRETWDAAQTISDPAVRELVRGSVKFAYKQGHGYWRSPQSTVQRPDWAAAVTAMSRANLFRKVWRVWAGDGDTFTGSYPVWIDVDNVWYPHKVRPQGWRIWDPLDLPAGADMDSVTKLGDWRVGGMKRRKIVEGPHVSRETSEIKC